MKDNPIGIIIILLIVAVGLTGGIKNSKFIGNSSPTSTSSPQKLSDPEIKARIQDAEYKKQDLERQLAIENERKNSSIYKDKILFNWGSSSSDPNFEYIEISANYNNTEPINITGWALTSTSTNQSVTIPKSTSLYFAGQANSEENVYLKPGERAYIITGRSPIGYGLRTNKCSGYLSQFNTFYPGLYSQCPSARNEDLSQIRRSPSNDNCFDLIDSYPTCRVQTEMLNNSYSSECQNFIKNKMTYPNCISVHKNDPDFWGSEWRVYLKRSEVLWKTRRETVILYDNTAKPVGKIYRH